MKLRHRSGIALLSMLLVSTVAYSDTANNSNGTTDEQRKQIESIVHDYILKNPEVLVQSLQAMQQKQIEQAQKSIQKTQELAPKFADQLFRNPADPVMGDPKGAVTLVEFFDYQCPHCLAVEPTVAAIIKANPNLRVVYKEFPMRGGMSETASKAALAALKQGKYAEFHHEIMSAKQLPLTEAIIYKAAKDAGLDLDKLKKDMALPAISDQLKANMKLGQGIQLLGTPAFFIAKTDIKQDADPKAVILVPGQVEPDQLQMAISQVK